MGIYTLATYSRQNKTKQKMIRLPSLSLETWPPEKNAVDCTRALTFTLLAINAAIVWLTYEITKGEYQDIFN